MSAESRLNCTHEGVLSLRWVYGGKVTCDECSLEVAWGLPRTWKCLAIGGYTPLKVTAPFG